MTFKQWIKTYRGQNNPIGDLASDIWLDEKFPKAKRRETILAYLEKCGASDGAISAFEEAWEIYHSEIQ